MTDPTRSPVRATRRRPPRTGAEDADDLAVVLRAAGIPGPYVMVGHSIGSHIVRLFTTKQPSSVVGMVLVDPSHEDQDVRRQTLVGPELFAALQAALSANPEGFDLTATATQVRTARVASPLPRMPLIVVSAGIPDDVDQFPQGWPLAAEAALHTELPADLALLAPGEKQIIAQQSKHYVHQYQPELVVGAIRDVVAAARQSAAR
jgi:pimeloyl-ACP methyl ester carboxylesterase